MVSVIHISSNVRWHAGPPSVLAPTTRQRQSNMANHKPEETCTCHGKHDEKHDENRYQPQRRAPPDSESPAVVSFVFVVAKRVCVWLDNVVCVAVCASLIRFLPLLPLLLLSSSVIVRPTEYMEIIANTIISDNNDNQIPSRIDSLGAQRSSNKKRQEQQQQKRYCQHYALAARKRERERQHKTQEQSSSTSVTVPSCRAKQESI